MFALNLVLIHFNKAVTRNVVWFLVCHYKAKCPPLLLYREKILVET